VEEDVTAFEQVEEVDGSDNPMASARDIDFPATAWPVLRELSHRIRAAIPRSGDAITRAHLRQCLREVGALLSEE
jgi:hypothetical protein